MVRDPRVYLWDVQDAADAIRRFTQGLDVDGYAANPLVRAAVERQFEIVGEALNQLSIVDPDLAGRIPDLRQIVDFRNRLIHGYRRIDHMQVWRIAETLLPALRKTVSVRPMSKSSTITRKAVAAGVATPKRVTVHPGEVLRVTFAPDARKDLTAFLDLKEA